MPRKAILRPVLPTEWSSLANSVVQSIQEVSHEEGGSDRTAGVAAKGAHVALTTSQWGLMGFLWNRPVVTMYIRPSRYTFEFLRSVDRFTVSFFPQEMAPALRYCATHRGWNEDKLAGSGLVPERIGDYVLFSQSNLTFACRRLYMRPMDESLIMDKGIVDEYYEDKDVHWSFSGQIEHVYI